MTRWMPWLLAAACILIGSGLWAYRARRVVAAPRSPEALVRSAWTDGRRVALEGVQTLVTEGAPAPIRAEVVTSADGQMRIRYRTAPLQGVTIWESGTRTYRYNPNVRRLTVAVRRHPAEASAEAAILANYVPRLRGQDRIAGRPALVVELRPKRRRGYWKRLWIDPQTSVILASEDRRAAGSVIRSTRFETIRYFPPGAGPDPRLFRPPDDLVRRYGAALPGDSGSRFEPAALSRIVGFPVREPRRLPEGYRLLGAYPTPCPCGRRHQAARLEYGDGLNTISLFECGHSACANHGNCFAGEDDSLGVSVRRGRYAFFAIGDAPRLELQKMVRSASDL